MSSTVLRRAAPRIHTVLMQPQIPGNTGTIARTCVAFDSPLELVKPLGFDLSESRLKRAGLDYWQWLQLRVFDHAEAWLAEQRRFDHVVVLSKAAQFGTMPIQDWHIPSAAQNVALVFGSETAGVSWLPEVPGGAAFLRDATCVYLPQQHVRSLNLSNTHAAVLTQAMLQTRSFDQLEQQAGASTQPAR